MTKLEAVRLIMRRCGLLPVTALDTDGFSIAADVERELDDTELEVQAMGWHYNTRVDVELEPDVDDHIQVPTGTIAIDVAGAHFDVKDGVQVGQYLFDRENNTDEFDSSVQASYRLRYGFGCIPYQVRKWIVAKAALKFAESRFPKQAALRLLYEEERDAEAMARQYDGDASDVNLLRTPDSRAVKGGRDGPWLFVQNPKAIEV